MGKCKMFKDAADFEKIVGRLNLNDQPNPAHREELRRQMLGAFDEASGESSGAGSEVHAQSSTVFISPLVKLAAAAVILIVAGISVYQLTRPADSRIVAKDDEIDGSKAVHIGTPDLVPIELDLPRPMFVGTPHDTRVANLEKPLGMPWSVKV